MKRVARRVLRVLSEWSRSHRKCGVGTETCFFRDLSGLLFVLWWECVDGNLSCYSFLLFAWFFNPLLFWADHLALILVLLMALFRCFVRHSLLLYFEILIPPLTLWNYRPRFPGLVCRLRRLFHTTLLDLLFGPFLHLRRWFLGLQEKRAWGLPVLLQWCRVYGLKIFLSTLWLHFCLNFAVLYIRRCHCDNLYPYWTLITFHQAWLAKTSWHIHSDLLSRCFYPFSIRLQDLFADIFELCLNKKLVANLAIVITLMPINVDGSVLINVLIYVV